MELAKNDSGEKLTDPGQVSPKGWYSDTVRLTARLRLLGDLPARATIPPDSKIYEGALVDAVKHFQERHGLTPTGELDSKTIAEMNVPLSDGIRIAFGQFLLEGRIVSINIGEEVNVSVFLDDSSLVSDQHGNRRSKIYLYVIAALVHGVLNPFQIPLGVVAENPGGELGRFLRVDAPMADCPFFSGELLLALGSVVNVDVVFVGKHELDQSQRILWTRWLPYR
jgi:putative peptidoglycan binding protein